MNTSTIYNINTSTTNDTSGTDKNTRNNNFNNNTKKNIKPIWQLGNKHLVVLDESIIQKLGITDDSIFFVEQEITDNNTAILMTINKFQTGGTLN